MAQGSGYFQVDPQGNLIVPAEVAGRFGMRAGARVKFEEGPHALLLHRPVEQLARLYIEPTTECNLTCGTCIRHAWNEPLGRMSEATFKLALDGLQSFQPLPLVFFGGFGEPLTHPDIFRMIREVKRLGTAVELITNGTLLDEDLVPALLESELDTLWVSVDGAADCGHAGGSAEAGLNGILSNVRKLQLHKSRLGRKLPQVGLAFVAMSANVAEFPELLRWGLRNHIRKYSVSNLLPHTAEMKEQILFRRALYDIDYGAEVQLPRLDGDESTLKLIHAVLREDAAPRFEEQASERRRDSCPFVQKGSASIRWDGQVSPCLPLLHTHESYLADRKRRIEAFSVGALTERSLQAIWQDPGYETLRSRLLDFDFSPCSWCNSCDFPDANREDCFGSPAPACGGCLWAQGFIRCP
jgi:MoaA/NifB/PqqE/SkfB family radical SAM enzyme